MRSVVTLALPRKRLNRTSSARSPLESRRRHTSLPATMRPTSAAPLYRDDDPRTGPTSNQSAATCWHLRPSRSAAIEATGIADSGIPYLRPESIRRTGYVHALARKRGPINTGRGCCRKETTSLRKHHGLWLWVPGRASLARDDSG